MYENLAAQHQTRQPGRESAMQPQPQAMARHYVGSGKLVGNVAIVTGGDSGIGRAVAVMFAKEGADVVVSYLDEHDDARITERAVRDCGRQCLLVPGDVSDPGHCGRIVQQAMQRLGRLDILVNNAGEQHPQDDPLRISAEQLQRTFAVNLFSMFYMVQAALPHMKAGGRIINTSSVTAYRGSAHLIDYAATKGAIVAFTRSLSQALVELGILVNGVAPGPVWTPLIPSSFDAHRVQQFGSQVPLKRPAQPDEIAPAYVFLASSDSDYMTGQVLHPNGGEIVNA
jgi:hypothetical protein